MFATLHMWRYKRNIRARVRSERRTSKLERKASWLMLNRVCTPQYYASRDEFNSVKDQIAAIKSRMDWAGWPSKDCVEICLGHGRYILATYVGYYPPEPVDTGLEYLITNEVKLGLNGQLYKMCKSETARYEPIPDTGIEQIDINSLLLKIHHIPELIT